MNHHFWCGEWIDDAEVSARLDALDRDGHQPPVEALDAQSVIAACGRLAAAIDSGAAPAARLATAATDPQTAAAGSDVNLVDAVLRDLRTFLQPASLRHTLRVELGERPRLADGPSSPRGGRAPATIDDASAEAVEAWEPLGLLAHVVPANAAIAGPVSLVEGLLSGNANIVKTSTRQGLLTQRVAAELVAFEPRIAPYVTVLRFGSGRRSWLRAMCRAADGVVVWGGDGAVDGVAELVPAGARLVVWGPKLSFAYLTAATWDDPDVLAAVANDICATDQLACTSPQVVYLDTDRDEELWAVAGRVADALAEVDRGYPAPRPGLHEQAEITNTVLVCRHEEHLGLSRVWSAPDGRWHVLAENDPVLRASPLFRTIWVKPLPRTAIVATLRPMRRYLQTVGVGAVDLVSPQGAPTELARTLIAAGADRLTATGGMHGSYPGEPHDGEYPLRRYSRRVTVRLPA